MPCRTYVKNSLPEVKLSKPRNYNKSEQKAIKKLSRTPNINATQIFIYSSHSLYKLFITSSSFIPRLALKRTASPSLSVSRSAFTSSVLSSNDFISSTNPFAPSAMCFAFAPYVKRMSIFCFRYIFRHFHEKHRCIFRAQAYRRELLSCGLI